jgi:hypothetical protein
MKTQLVIDLNSVSHAEFFYVQQDSITVRHKPKGYSVHGIAFLPDEYAWPFDHKYALETKLERAVRLEVLDIWQPVCVYQFRNNHSKTFKGETAKKRWRQYNEHIFNRKRK